MIRMKTLKCFYLLLAATVAIAFTSCSDDDENSVTPTPPPSPKSTIIDFEDVTIPTIGYQNNFQYTSKEINFYNKYNSEYTSYEGFAYSKLTDQTTPGLANQYSVYGDGGAEKSAQFAVAYQSYDTLTNFRFAANKECDVKSVMVNNSTFAALDIKTGSDFSKQFVAGDWFKVIFTGYNAAGKAGKTVEFYLADYRNGKSDICAQWTKVDLSSLGKVNSIAITFDSTDKGEWGINTPQYVCLDNLTYIAN